MTWGHVRVNVTNKSKTLFPNIKLLPLSNGAYVRILIPTKIFNLRVVGSSCRDWPFRLIFFDCLNQCWFKPMPRSLGPLVMPILILCFPVHWTPMDLIFIFFLWFLLSRMKCGSFALIFQWFLAPFLGQLLCFPLNFVHSLFKFLLNFYWNFPEITSINRLDFIQ